MLRRLLCRARRDTRGKRGYDGTLLAGTTEFCGGHDGVLLAGTTEAVGSRDPPTPAAAGTLVMAAPTGPAAGCGGKTEA